MVALAVHYHVRSETARVWLVSVVVLLVHGDPFGHFLLS